MSRPPTDGSVTRGSPEMNHRRLFAAVGLAGALAVAACGAEDQVTKPAAQPANASQNAAEAFQHYYDVTHPAPKTKPANASRTPPRRSSTTTTSPALCRRRSRPVSLRRRRRLCPVGEAGPEPSGADVYVPSVKPAREPSGDADVYVPSIVRPDGRALRPRRSRNLEPSECRCRSSWPRSRSRDGLTGLSPAFLQRVEPCSGLSPASTSGCTTDELNAACRAIPAERPQPPGGASMGRPHLRPAPSRLPVDTVARQSSVTSTDASLRQTCTQAGDGRRDRVGPRPPGRRRDRPARRRRSDGGSDETRSTPSASASAVATPTTSAAGPSNRIRWTVTRPASHVGTAACATLFPGTRRGRRGDVVVGVALGRVAGVGARTVARPTRRRW